MRLIDNIYIAEMILMLSSTVINVLFLAGFISDAYVQYGFILVILCGIGINYLLMKEKNNKKEKVVKLRVKKNILSIIIVVVICLSWITTYYLAIFNR